MRLGRGGMRLTGLLIGLALVLGCSTISIDSPTQNPSTSGSTRAAPSPRASAEETARPPYFEVDGGEGASLLIMGTIHLGPRAGWRLSDEILAGLARADAFRLEVDPRAIDEDQVASILARRVVLPVGTTLEDVIEPETVILLQEYDARLTEFGLPEQARRRLKPWYLAMGLIQGASARSGYHTAQASDLTVLDSAGDRPLEGLETFDEALLLLDSLSPQLQDLMLRDTVSRLEEAVAEVDSLIRAWRRGDRDALAALARQGVEDLPELTQFYDVLLNQRNRRWLSLLRALLDDPAQANATVFVGVGALHVVGPDSIPALLEDAGYRVTTLH